MSENSGHAFIDHHSVVKIDASEFQAVRDFSDGLAAVLTNEYRWGFIDKTGSLVITTAYAEVREFREGFAVVQALDTTLRNGRDEWGYVDRSGKMVIDGYFDSAYSFSEGAALAERGDAVLLVNKDGQATPLFHRNPLQLAIGDGDPKFVDGLVLVWDETTSKYGYMDRNGKLVIPAIYKNAASFSEGLARVSIIRNNRELMGFIDSKGDFVIPPKFDVDFDFNRNATDFSEGWASVIDGPPTTETDSKFVYIDKSGNVVLETPYFRIEQFKEGKAAVYDAELDRYGFIAKSGELVIPLQYTGARDFSEGLAGVEFTRSRNNLFKP